MRRDRTGEPIEDDDEHDYDCPRGCRDGWINDGQEAERPMPCPRCRPWARRSGSARSGPGSSAAGREAARRIWAARTAPATLDEHHDQEDQ